MITILYKWRIKPEKELQFIKAWSEITDYFRENCDSLGSRLHRGNDNFFYGYAQWKLLEDREKAFLRNNNLAEASQKMRDAIAELFDEIILDPIADFLILPEKIDNK